LIRMRHYMSALMAQDAHAFGPGPTLDFENHFLFQLHQPRMRQIEWNGDSGRVLRAEPFTGNPGVRPDPNVMLVKLAVKRFEAACEPGALDRDFEVFEPDLEQLIVGQRSPGEFPTWHGATKSEKPYRRSCHGVPKATTVNAVPGEVLNISRHLVLRQSEAPTDPAPAWASGTVRLSPRPGACAKTFSSVNRLV